MNTLEKKLAKSGEDKMKAAEAIVQDAKLLLASDTANELETLKLIGLDGHIQVAQAKQEDVIIRNSNRDKYGRQVVHISEIRKLCEDYRLYMRKTNQYMGVVPPELGAELTRFCKEKNIPLPSSSDYSNFAIIAPPKMFRDYQSPGQVVANAWNDQMAEREERIRKAKEDPILVYRLLDRNDYFVIVKSWGSDFTPLRRLYGMLTRPISLKWANFLINLLLVGTVLKLSWNGGMWMFSHITKNISHPGWHFAGAAIIATAVILCGLWIFNEDCYKFRNRILRIVTKENDKGSIQKA